MGCPQLALETVVCVAMPHCGKVAEPNGAVATDSAQGKADATSIREAHCEELLCND